MGTALIVSGCRGTILICFSARLSVGRTSDLVVLFCVAPCKPFLLLSSLSILLVNVCTIRLTVCALLKGTWSFEDPADCSKMPCQNGCLPSLRVMHTMQSSSNEMLTATAAILAPCLTPLPPSPCFIVSSPPATIFTGDKHE